MSQALRSKPQFWERESGAYSGQRSDKSGGCKVEMERERERDTQGVGVRGSCQQGSRCLEPASVVGSRDELDSQGPQRFSRFVNLPAQVVQ